MSRHHTPSHIIATAICIAAHSAQAQPDIRVGPFLQHATPTSIWVVWETDTGTESIVEHGPSETLVDTTPGIALESTAGTIVHQVQLTDLEPDTPYFYRVRTADAISDTARLRTPPLTARDKPFRFVAYSDSQGDSANPAKHTEVINDGVIDFVTEQFGPRMSDELAFLLHAGDLVDAGSKHEQWKDQFFDECQNLIEHIPLYPATGNHEQDSPNYFDYFRLPENGTPGFLEHWYHFDYGNVRIIALDTNTDYRIPQQLDWLDKVLADTCDEPDIDFVFAFFHHPHLSEPWTPGNTPFSTEIVRRVEQFSTDCDKPSIHFFGHTHAYSRGQSRDHTHLMVNVASGEGNTDYWGEYANADYDEFQRSFVDWGFVLVEVEAGDKPKFRLRRVSRGNEIVKRDNEVLDDITIRNGNLAPFRPTARSPRNGKHGLDADLITLSASRYKDRDGDQHLETHFQILSPGHDEPVAENWIRAENWFAPPGATGPENGYYSVDTAKDLDITTTTFKFLEPATTYAWRVRYRDKGLAWSDWSSPTRFTTADRNEVVLLEENFDSLTLRDAVDEADGTNVWTPDAPPRWSVDRSRVPGINDPTQGVTEWEGWSFADKDWWARTAGDQRRTEFTRASGTIAVADADEWDDLGDPEALGKYTTSLTTPPIGLDRIKAGTLRITFDSSWRPDPDQKARVTIAYDGGDPVDIVTWHSDARSPLFKTDDATNEKVTLLIDNPTIARTAVLTFALFDAANDWWWAIDNLRITGEPGP